ncbi:hypothetical protein D3C86_1809720 [compost metagenome]
MYALLIAFQRGNCGDLERRKGAVIVVTLDSRQGVNQRFITDHKSDTPARHVVAF